jgi:hypothetical protein
VAVQAQHSVKRLDEESGGGSVVFVVNFLVEK